MAEPNNFPIGILLFIIVTLTALGYLLLAYSIKIWPFASKPTCDNIDGNGKSFTCTSGPVKKGVTCATSTCTEKECCTDTNTPTPPPPPPPTPPSAVCQNTTQGGSGWNAIKGCKDANCENQNGDCSAGGQGTIQCSKWTLPYGTCSVSDNSTWRGVGWAETSCSKRKYEKDCKNKNYDTIWKGGSECKWTTDLRQGECQELEFPPDACFKSDNWGTCWKKEDKDSCESCSTTTLDCCEPVSTESFRRR